jgi:hypothetical protein
MISRPHRQHGSTVTHMPVPALALAYAMNEASNGNLTGFVMIYSST